MKNKKLFDLDKDQKDFLQRVSAKCGLDRLSTQTVWEFTLFTMLMDIAENPDSAYNVLQIPYIGNILFMAIIFLHEVFQRVQFVMLTLIEFCYI